MMFADPACKAFDHNFSIRRERLFVCRRLGRESWQCWQALWLHRSSLYLCRLRWSRVTCWWSLLMVSFTRRRIHYCTVQSSGVEWK